MRKKILEGLIGVVLIVLASMLVTILTAPLYE